MLSYIHAFHAGNHGDILKHITFSLVLEHLLKKDKPFSVIDTHSASGIYKLDDERLLKTGEAADGITKLLESQDYDSLKELCSSYTNIVFSYCSKGYYPGSPEIARCMMRKDDQLILNELHPQIILDLKANIKKPLLTEKTELPHIAVHNRNCTEMLNGCVPPQIKRGCVIIDPSYEDESDFSDTADMFISAYKKWSSATYLIWYPLLEHRTSQIERMKETVELIVEQNNLNTDDKKCQYFELKIKDPSEMTGLASLYGSGMLIVNPPYGLSEKLNQIIPLLEKILK